MSDHTDSMLIGRITVGTRRQYAEQSLKWDAVIASEKTDDELLQRIWNLAEDAIALIAALAEAKQRIAYLTAEAHGWQPRLAQAEAEVERYRRHSCDNWRYCEGGTGSCEVCVGSCGVEEFDEHWEAVKKLNDEMLKAAVALAEDTRLPECVANWPECEDGAYDPRCCRFPKSCSCAALAEEDA